MIKPYGITAAAAIRAMEQASGVSTLRRGDPPEPQELAPVLVKLFTDNEDSIVDSIASLESVYGFRQLQLQLPSGEFIRFVEPQFAQFQKDKDYYTSPLYRALL